MRLNQEIDFAAAKKYITVFLSLLFVLSVNLYFRSYPIFFPILREQAKSIIDQRLSANAAKEINRQFSNYSDFAKTRLFSSILSSYRNKDKKETANQINLEYQRLKDRFQDKYGQTYLMELDGWHFARFVENLVTLDHPGDQIINGKNYDSLSLAPSGSEMAWSNFLYYLSAILYKIFSFFKPLPLYHFLFYLPLFFITILIVVLFFICYKSWGNLAAVLACLYVGLAPIFIPRSCVGWFDTDILNLLFPLLVAFSYIAAYNHSAWQRRLFWVGLASFWLGLFSFTWNFWSFIFGVISIYEIFTISNLISEQLQYKENNRALLRQHIENFIFFIVCSFFWIMLFSGPRPIFYLFSPVSPSIIRNKPLVSYFWPNVFSTVGELKSADFLTIASTTGGKILFILAIFFLLVLILNNKTYSHYHREAIFILAIWFMLMYFVSFKGVRFTIFLLIPLGIFLGWGMNELLKYIKQNRQSRWLTPLLILLLIPLCLGMFNNAHKVSMNIYPLMNDGWYSLLNTLKDRTPSNAIINSWWDFGDWFKAVAKRRVIFDGQSQNTPQAYWMGRVLLTDNEREALGILRMLNNGGNKAFDILSGHLQDPFRSIYLLKKAILMEPSEAEVLFAKFLPADKLQQLMQLLFAKPDPAYFIVDESMVGKMSPISYLGSWDFIKLYVIQNMQKKGKKEIIDYLATLDIDRKTAEDIYEEAALISKKDLDGWISRRSVFYSVYVKGEAKNGIVLFDNGFVYNPEEQTVYSYFAQEGRYRVPRSLFISKDNRLGEVIYRNSDLDFSVLIMDTPVGYYLCTLSRELAKSLFARLFFWNGKGLEYFRPYTVEKGENEKIGVFEIIWDINKN